MLAEAKTEATINANKIIEEARTRIEAERDDAFKQLKAEILNYSVQIAEIILKQKLEQDNTHQKLIDKYLTEMKLN
jgi:F-type H+-transporting ATPase subunit b